MLTKLFLVLLIWLVAFMPLELFLLIRYLLEPNGFWQNFILFGLGMYLLGVFQILFFVAGISATVVVISGK